MSAKKGKKSDDSVDFDAIVRAIRAIKIKQKSVRSVALAHGIPKTSLHRYMGKVNEKYADISQVNDEQLKNCVRGITAKGTKTVFSARDEGALVEYIVKCSKHYNGLSITELRQVAYQYAIKMNIDCPESWNTEQMAGGRWCYGFMKRHRSSLGRCDSQDGRNSQIVADPLHTLSFSSVLNEIGPLQPAETERKLYRVRKPIRSSVSTSSENIADLKEEQRKRVAANEKIECEKDSQQSPKKAVKQPQAKRAKEQTPLQSSSSIQLKSTNMRQSFFICQNCGADSDLESDKSEEKCDLFSC